MSISILHVRVQAAYPCPSCISMSMVYGYVHAAYLHVYLFV
jgi:hypothetical protein